MRLVHVAVEQLNHPLALTYVGPIKLLYPVASQAFVYVLDVIFLYN